MKKLLSLLCVCAVAVSLLTSFVSVSASAAPSITYELNFANTGETLSDAQDANWEYDSLHGVAPLYKATLTLKGAVAKTPVRDESNTIVANNLCFGSFFIAQAKRSTVTINPVTLPSIAE